MFPGRQNIVIILFKEFQKLYAGGAGIDKSPGYVFAYAIRSLSICNRSLYLPNILGQTDASR